MTKTVAEIFQAIKGANNASLEAVTSGKFDAEAEQAIWILTPVLFHCDTPLVLDEKQIAAFERYQQPVPARE